MEVYNIGIERGKHCTVYLIEGEDGMCLKVFDVYPQDSFSQENLDKMRWGDLPKRGNPNMSVLLTDATKIQNLCWIHGYAPRVYGIVGAQDGNKRYYAQKTEYLGECFSKSNESAEEVYLKVKELGNVYGFCNEKNDCSHHDVISGKLVDFIHTCS